MMRRRFDLSLYLVLDPLLCRGIGMAETTRAAVTGGATMVQLRDKDGGTAALIETGRALKAVLAGSGVPLIVNDDVEAAIAIGADGLHIGQDDVQPAQARQVIGPDRILGLSVETADLAGLADPALVDYIGAGPVFATPTKPGHKPACGFPGLAAMVRASPLPAVAIGGLKRQHVAPVLASGAKGLAVVSAICGQPDPAAATRDLIEAIQEFRSSSG